MRLESSDAEFIDALAGQSELIGGNPPTDDRTGSRLEIEMHLRALKERGLADVNGVAHGVHEFRISFENNLIREKGFAALVDRRMASKLHAIVPGVVKRLISGPVDRPAIIGLGGHRRRREREEEREEKKRGSWL
jgi:hypothetical protein